MKDAEVMKALTVSMGIASQDIMVDDTPVNTQQMISDLAGIAEENDWHSMIIVSSRYHMLRVKLLCAKYLKDKTVYYVPAERSNFYLKELPVSVRYIGGVLHEYIAIAYYRIKKYI